MANGAISVGNSDVEVSVVRRKNGKAKWKINYLYIPVKRSVL